MEILKGFPKGIFSKKCSNFLKKFKIVMKWNCSKSAKHR